MFIACTPLVWCWWCVSLSWWPQDYQKATHLSTPWIAGGALKGLLQLLLHGPVAVIRAVTLMGPEVGAFRGEVVQLVEQPLDVPCSVGALPVALALHAALDLAQTVVQPPELAAPQLARQRQRFLAGVKRLDARGDQVLKAMGTVNNSADHGSNLRLVCR